MASGAYRLRTARFEKLVYERKYRSLQHFCDEHDIRRSTLDDMRRGVHEPSLTNVRKVLDAFDGDYPFANLFEPTPVSDWIGVAA
jgi:hypothetical protein